MHDMNNMNANMNMPYIRIHLFLSEPYIKVIAPLAPHPLDYRIYCWSKTSMNSYYEI
jgi:hypothetical protein